MNAVGADGSGLTTVHFLLPRFSRRAVGGYKVVYQYANALAARGVGVVVHHSYGVDHVAATGFSRSRAQVLRWWVASARDRVAGRPPWFALDDRVRISLSMRGYSLDVRPGDVVVATSPPTVPHAVRAIAGRSGVGGVYFIQHYESWLVDEEYLRDTWRSGLRLVVIAPWLLEAAEGLGLRAHLVQNAIDADEFEVGIPLTARPGGVCALWSTAQFKRRDVVAAVLNALARRSDLSVTAFGTSTDRPAELAPEVEWLSAPDSGRLAALFRSAPLYLCCSDSEGWHLPPAEASMCGAAIVSTDIGGVRAYAEDDAFYASTGDVAGLVAAATDALAHRSLAEARAGRVRERLLARTPAIAADEFRRELEASLTETS